MKTIVLGDTHGRSMWKLITHTEKPDRVIFIGDYFDSFDISGVEQLHNFKEIIEYKEKGECEVIMLIGNHDHHYFPEVGNTDTSGYQTTLAPSINQAIDENRHHLQMAYQMGEYLFTHAGVSSEFMDSVFGTNGSTTESIAELLNEQFKYKPRTFSFGMAVDLNKVFYLDQSGDNTQQSPIWIRPRSLMAANRNTLRTKVIQVVGHTQVRTMTGQEKMSGGRYFLTDCLETSGEYLIIEDGKTSIGKI